MSYEEKMFGIVVVRSGGDQRLFARVRRSKKGDVYVIWAEDESPENLSKGSNAHASYHADGRMHSKTYDRAATIKRLQPPAKKFRGNQPLEATNADRALSPTLPLFGGGFDGQFDLHMDLLTGKQNRWITVDLVEPGMAPIRMTGADRVLAERVFKDAAPWIVVSLVEALRNLQ